jgi:hypothetical protein
VSREHAFASYTSAHSIPIPPRTCPYQNRNQPPKLLQWRSAACLQMPCAACLGANNVTPRPAGRCELNATVDVTAAIGGGGLQATALYVCPEGRRFALCGQDGKVYMAPPRQGRRRDQAGAFPLSLLKPLPALVPWHPTR